MFRLEIKTGNAAFDDGQKGPELARIIRNLADELADSGDVGEGYTWNLYDLNGNYVGSADVDDDDDD